MTSNSIKSLIDAEYAKLHEQREQYEKEYKESLYNALPIVEEIDKEIAILAVKWAYKVVTDGITPEEALATVEKKRDDLKLKREKIIAQANYPAFEALPYKCSKCKDTGEISGEKCICYKQYLRKFMIDGAKQVSHFSCDIENDNFDNFKFEYYDKQVHPALGISPYENIKRIFSFSKKYCETFGETSPNLFINGASGLGKTYLANCITNELLSKGHTVVYQSAASMFRFLEDYKFDKVDREANEDYNKSIYDCELLIIDDLGTEFPTTYTSSVFFDVLNTRLLNNRKTIISTNTSVRDVEKRYTERISSRILGEFRILTLIGSDIRRRKLESKNGGTN